MRFEMKTDDVMGLITIIRNAAPRIKELEPSFAAVLRGDLFRMLRKLKVYALKAYPNRQRFRDEMKELEEMISNA